MSFNTRQDNRLLSYKQEAEATRRSSNFEEKFSMRGRVSFSKKADEEVSDSTNIKLLSNTGHITTTFEDNDTMNKKHSLLNQMNNYKNKLVLLDYKPKKHLDTIISVEMNELDRLSSKRPLVTSKKHLQVLDIKNPQSIRNSSRKMTRMEKKPVVSSAAMSMRKNYTERSVKAPEYYEIDEESLEVSYLKNQIKHFQIAIAIIVLINIFLTTIDNQLFKERVSSKLQELSIKGVYSSESLLSFKYEEESLMENIIRAINIFICLIADYLTVKSYSRYMDIQKYFSYYTNEDNLFSSGKMKNILFELFILSINPPPFYNSLIRGQISDLLYFYSLDSLFLAFSFLKIFTVFRAFSHFTKWLLPANLAISKKYIGTPGIKFATKSVYRQNPFKIIIFSFCCIILVFGFTLNVLDFAVFSEVSEGHYQKVDISLEISFWLIVETCSTVGYGEYTPKSLLGKLNTIISGLFGWFVISLLILVAGEKLDLKGEEIDSFILYKKTIIREKTERQAKVVISNILLFRFILMNQYKVKTFPFLLANKSYDIFSILKVPNDLKKKIYNDLHSTHYTINTEIESILNRASPTFINFYNKIIMFNKVSQESIGLHKLLRFLNSFLPSTNEEMNRLTRSIDKNFIKMDDYISNRLGYLKEEFKELSEMASGFRPKIEKILEMQLKIAGRIVSANNESFFKIKI